jgi:flavin-dependent dehydrogenase
MQPVDASRELSYDVVVIGGAIAGASAAFLLKRQHPSLRILIIEKSEQFDRKVGESTSEVSACFLTRVLNLAHHLGHEQISKSGLRLWFYRNSEDDFSRCTEVGPKSQPRLATFQLDRSKLDQKILEKAANAGCELWRPAKLLELDLAGERKNKLKVKVDEEFRSVTARWVIDGSGRAATISRKLKLFEPLTAHPISSVWARFRNTTDLDGASIWESNPQFTEICWTMRQWATNHLMGYGWWCWIIPLKGGDFSVGIVYDSRIFQLPHPSGATLAQRLKSHLLTHPLGRKLFADAEPNENDTRAYSMLSFYSKQTVGDGWALVGDAAGFLDPLYSPGLDFVSYTVSNAVEIVGKSLAGEDISAVRDRYNKRYQAQFHTWFEGVYKDKYYYLGDVEMMCAAFLMDVGAYFLGPVRQAYSNLTRRYSDLPYAGPVGGTVGLLMRTYNRRLSQIAKRRMAAGVYGKKNLDQRILLPGFYPDFDSGKLMFNGFRRWLSLEVRNLFLRVPNQSVPMLEQAPSISRH